MSGGRCLQKSAFDVGTLYAAMPGYCRPFCVQVSANFDPLRRAGRYARRSDFDSWPVNKDSWRGAIQERRWQGLAFFRLASLRLQERQSAD